MRSLTRVITTYAVAKKSTYMTTLCTWKSYWIKGIAQAIVHYCSDPRICTVGYNDFNNLVLPGRWWLLNWILRHIYKKAFQFFSAVSSAFAFKVCKKCWYEKKKMSKMQYGSQKHRIWCWFRIHWKSCKKISRKSERGMEFLTFITVCESCRPITFFEWFFLHFYEQIWTEHQFCSWRCPNRI